MLGGLFLFSLIITVMQLINEACEPTIPAENWANKDLIYEDTMKGTSEKEFSQNLVDGKYKITEIYPEPHRMADGRIIIEDYKTYKADVRKYGAYQAHKWVKQGKYNLTPEELEKQHKEFDERMERLYHL